MPTLQDRPGVQKPLSMTNFDQQIALRPSQITSPLRSLLQSDTRVIWDEDVHGEAIKIVKNVLSNTPQLRFFNENKELVLQYDASESGFGPCIIQEKRSIMYESR